MPLFWTRGEATQSGRFSEVALPPPGFKTECRGAKRNVHWVLLTLGFTGGKNPRTLKPFGLVCPTTLVQCKQEVAQELIKSGIDKQVIQNDCGNINIDTKPSTNGPQPGTVTIAASRNQLIGAAVVTLLIILLGVAGVIYFARR